MTEVVPPSPNQRRFWRRFHRPDDSRGWDSRVEMMSSPEAGEIDLWVHRDYENEVVTLTPADAIAIGRALVEMGEAIKTETKGG